MKIYTETRLRDFEFWAGAKETVSYLTDEELDQIEDMLTDRFPEGMDETAVNHFFWFEDDQIADLLGYEDFGDIMRRDRR